MLDRTSDRVVRAARRRPPLRARLLLVVLATLAGGGPAAAHDVAGQILVESFVKPEGDRLHVLVRLPLVMLQGLGLPRREDGFLDLARIDAGLERAGEALAREILFFEADARLSPERIDGRISELGSRAFESFDQAYAHVSGPPLAPGTEVFWNQGHFDAHMVYPIRSDRSDFALDLRLGTGLGERLKLVVTYLPRAAAARTFEVHGGSGRLALDPGWGLAATTFLERGFTGVARSLDGLVLLLCLVLPVRLGDRGRVAAVVLTLVLAQTAALVAASASPAAAAPWLTPAFTALVAAAVVVVAVHNIVLAWIGAPDRPGRRWPVAALAGLALGVALAPAFTNNLQFAGAHRALALAAFDLGAGLAATLAVVLTAAALTLLLRGALAWRIGVVLGSAFAAHAGWHWLLERIETLRLAGAPGF